MIRKLKVPYESLYFSWKHSQYHLTKTYAKSLTEKLFQQWNWFMVTETRKWLLALELGNWLERSRKEELVWVIVASDQIRSDQSLSRVRLFATPWIAAHQASLSITNSQSSLRLTSIKSAMPSSHLILCCPLFLLPPIPPSIRVFSNESTLHMRWPKYWSFSFSSFTFVLIEKATGFSFRELCDNVLLFLDISCYVILGIFPWMLKFYL